MYFAVSFSKDSDGRTEHPAQETIELAMSDADSVPDQEAQIIRLSGLKAVVASREAGQPWRKI